MNKKIKVSVATDLTLDLLVSRADNQPEEDGWGWFKRDKDGFLLDPLNECRYSPSTDWAQGGPIIERNYIDIIWDSGNNEWNASMIQGRFVEEGPTPLIAVMRCYVASKLGDVVEIPEELL